jgi:hypothetical protein
VLNKKGGSVLQFIKFSVSINGTSQWISLFIFRYFLLVNPVSIIRRKKDVIKELKNLFMEVNMAIHSLDGDPSTLTTLNPQVALKVRELAQTLRERGAQNGARRLEVVAQQLQHFTVEGATQYIRKEEILQELEGQNDWKTNVLYSLRAILCIAPIAFTWWALHLAGDAYARDLQDTSHYPNDLYQPFLQLWQENFHGNHGFVLSFSLTTFLDALLLALLALLIIVVMPWWEQRRKEALRASLGNFDALVDDLLAAIGQSEANANPISTEINKVPAAIQATLQKVLLNYDRVAGEAREFVKDTYENTKALLKNFDTNQAVFHNDVKLLTEALQKINKDLDQNGKALQELTNLVRRLAEREPGVQK